MKRILFLIIILFLFSGIALGYELGAGSGTGYPGAIDTDTSVEVDYPDPLATTARAAVPNDTNAAVIAIETELGINPSGTYDTIKARLDAGDGLYYLKTEINTQAKMARARKIPTMMPGTTPAMSSLAMEVCVAMP